MSIVTADIPDKMRQNVERYIHQGYYKSKSDFVRDSIRKNLSDLERAPEVIPKGNVKNPVKHMTSLFDPTPTEEIDELIRLAEDEVF